MGGRGDRDDPALDATAPCPVSGAGEAPAVPGGHDHDHGAGAGADARYVGAALVLIVCFMVVEVVVAFLAGSLALLSDAGHMLTDAGALGASLWALHLAERPAAGRMTFGFKRAEILSAAANGVTLAALGVLLLATAVGRLVHPVHVHGAPLSAVAAAGVLVNVAATAVLARANRRRLNISGALAHLVTDVWAFAGTLAAGIVIMTTGFDRADPIASLAIVALMARAAYRLLRASGKVLLEAAPDDMDLADVRSHMLELPEVAAVHDLHVWVLNSDLPAVSAHVVVDERCFADGSAPRLLDQLQACLAGHFDVEHSTFQLEPAGHVDHESPQHD